MSKERDVLRAIGLSEPWTREQIERFVVDFRHWFWHAAPLDERGNEATEATRAWGKERDSIFLGSGFYRSVFLIPNGALKIATASDVGGRGPNRNEAHVWKTAPAGIRDLLVPVLDSEKNGNWLLMQEVGVMSESDMTGAGLSKMRRLMGALSETGISDFKPQNISMDGRLLDYGLVDRRRWRSWRSGSSMEEDEPAGYEPGS